MSLQTVFSPPGGQARLLAANDRYHELLSARVGKRFLDSRSAWAKASFRRDPGLFPLSLDLAVNSGCQLSCVMCPLPRRSDRKRFKAMDRSLFDRIIAQASEFSLAALTLGLASEPLLHPEIDSLVAAADRAGVMDIRLGTNGLALTPKLIGRLLDCGLTRLEISVDAAHGRAYAAIRSGGDFAALERSIGLFLDERSRRMQDLPLLRLSFLKLPENNGELEPFLRRWSDKADLISVQEPIWFPDSALPEPGESEKKGDEEGWCVQPWQRLGLDHEGAMWPCCSWYGEKLLNLSANSLPINIAWRSQAIEELRLAHLEKRLPAPCHECERHGAF